MNEAKTSGDRVTIVLPVARYELVDKFGMLRGRFFTAQEAADAAKRIWPDQEQDEERTGKGWDVQVVQS